MAMLVTGGAGYIGSHMVLTLLQAGHNVVVLDNLANANRESLRRVTELAGTAPTFIEADIRDRDALDTLFAGLKAVSGSVAEPLRYYENNMAGTLTLYQAMAAAGGIGWYSAHRPRCTATAIRCPSTRGCPPASPPTRMAPPR